MIDIEGLTDERFFKDFLVLFVPDLEQILVFSIFVEAVPNGFLDFD